jgi:hypothetical protein
MRRRRYIKGAGAAVVGSALAGCAADGSEETGDADENEDDTTNGSDGSSGAETGTLATNVTDRPVDIDDFESCVVTIEGLWVKPGGTEGDDPGDASEPDDADDPAAEDGDDADGDDDESEGDDDPEGDDDESEEVDTGEGRRYVGFEEPQEVDLVELQGSNTRMIDETELKVGEYRFLQLDVGGVDGRLNDGTEAEVDTPGNAPLQFTQSFEIRAGERTRFVADFAPVRRGQGDRYLLRPVATGTRVLYGDEEYDPDNEGESDPGDRGGDEESEGEGGGEPDDPSEDESDTAGDGGD